MPETRWSVAALLLIVLLGLGACASSGSRGADTGTPVTVADVKSVAGRWTGLMDLPGGVRNEDQYVEVHLRPDGTYRATSARTIGFMDAQGRITVSDGRLLVRGDQGALGRATLFSRDGQPTLMVDMTRPDGGRVTARLRPQP